MKKIITLYILFYFFNSVSFSQEKNLLFQVLDAKSKQPISYATLILKKLNRGSNANFNGEFIIPIKYKKEVLKISSIGYKSIEISLSNYTINKIHKVYLTASVNNLDEVLITSKKKKKKLLARGIVRRAIKNISINYPTNPYSYIGYYRDYQQPTDSIYKISKKIKNKVSYVNLHEGVVEVFDNGFQTNKFNHKKNKTALYKFETNKDFLIDSTLIIPYDNKVEKFSKSIVITPFGGNELNILNITNAIRNYNTSSFSFVNIFNKDFIENHHFRVKDIIDLDGTPLYEISFISLKHKTSNNHKAYGKIFISKYDFAIYKLNYNLFYKYRKKPQYSITIEYLPKGDKMYLNYITFNNFFEVSSEDYLKITDAVFNQTEKNFMIKFNKPIDLNSIEKSWNKNFKLYYDNKKLKILNISSDDIWNKTVTIKLDPNQLKKLGMLKKKNNSSFNTRFSLKVKNVKDKDGNIIYKSPTFNFYQFRELFVQEVFIDKKLPEQTIFINKSLPLNKAKISPFSLNSNYWINSPLKTSN